MDTRRGNKAQRDRNWSNDEESKLHLLKHTKSRSETANERDGASTTLKDHRKQEQKRDKSALSLSLDMSLMEQETKKPIEEKKEDKDKTKRKRKDESKRKITMKISGECVTRPVQMLRAAQRNEKQEAEMKGLGL